MRRVVESNKRSCPSVIARTAADTFYRPVELLKETHGRIWASNIWKRGGGRAKSFVSIRNFNLVATKISLSRRNIEGAFPTLAPPPKFGAKRHLLII